MEPPMQRSYAIRERPLAPQDYDVPVGWWGWNWEPPIPMSISELLAARNLDARTAALCWMVLEAHGSLLIAAEQPHSGKTTTVTAFLDFLPNSVRRVFVRGWAETFDFVEQTDPAQTLLLVNELSSHLPVYLWGPKAIEVFRGLRRGYALVGTLHADSAVEAVEQLTGELRIERRDLARVDLLLVMRIFRVGSQYGPIARRVVSMHRLQPGQGGVGLVELVSWDARHDRHEHDEAAELELLCHRQSVEGTEPRRRGAGLEPAQLPRPSGPGPSIDALRAELDRRSAFLSDLVERGVQEIPAVREALARYRGESVPIVTRGDPTDG